MEAETLWLSLIVAKEDSLKALEARLGEFRRARPPTVNSFDRNLTIFHLPFSRPTHRRDLRSVKWLNICKSFPFRDFFTSSRYDHGGFSYASTSSLSVSISGLLVSLYHPAHVAGRLVSSRLTSGRVPCGILELSSS